MVQRNKSESFYAAEIEGLNLFEAANVTAPRVIDSGEIAGDAYLILSFLHEGTKGRLQLQKDLILQSQPHKMIQTYYVVPIKNIPRLYSLFGKPHLHPHHLQG